MNSTCALEERLAQIEDPALAPETRAALLVHAEACSRCRAVLDERALQEVARATDPAAPPSAAPPGDGDASPLVFPDSGEFSSGDSGEVSSLEIPLAPVAATPPAARPPAPAAPAPGSPPKAAVPLGGYRLHERLGAGGAGIVYRATQLSVAREVALKILSPRLQDHRPYVERFLREAKAAARLSHPSIVRTYDAGFSGGRYFYAMELVRGESLRARIDARGALPPREVLSIVTDIARALEHAAELGIVHRDVKPDNILLEDATGAAKLADLGLARVDDGGGGGSLTTTGTVFGTPNYMSPEQARDTHAVDPRTDVYSLGATFHHALFGVRPFEAQSVPEILARVARERLEPPDGALAPPGYVEVIQRMTARRREDRYASARELIEDLESLAAEKAPRIALSSPPSGESGEAASAPHPPRRPARPPRSRTPPAAGLGVVIFLAAVCGIGWRLLGSEPAQARPATRVAASATTEGARAPSVAPHASAAAPTGGAEQSCDAGASRTAAAMAHARPSREEDARPPPPSGGETAAASVEPAPTEPPPSGASGGTGVSPSISNEALEALEEAAARRAREAYRPRLVEALALLSDLDVEGAKKVLASALDDEGLSAIKAEVKRDADDPGRVALVVERAQRGLAAKQGEMVRLDAREGDPRTGVVRLSGGTILLSEGGQLHSILLADLSEQALLSLADGLKEGPPLPPEARAALLVARGSDQAQAAIAGIADPEVANAYRAKLAITQGAAREAAATALLARTDKIYESKKKPRDAEKGYRSALEKYADTAPVIARRKELEARLAELVAQTALEADKGALDAALAKIFKGQAKRLSDGRVEVAYDFTRPDVAAQRGDFSTIDTSTQPQMKIGLERMQPSAPPPYDRAPAWQPCDGGLIGKGWERLLWKGRALSDAAVEVVCTPLIDRNAIVTLSDTGSPGFYAFALSFDLPRFPEFLRGQYPQLFQQTDPWHERTDAITEVGTFPDIQERQKGRTSSVVARRLLKIKVERKSGPKGEAKLTLDVGGSRILEAQDERDPRGRGGFALAAWHSAIVFRSAKFTGKLDPEWLKIEMDKLEAAKGEKPEKSEK